MKNLLFILMAVLCLGFVSALEIVEIRGAGLFEGNVFSIVTDKGIYQQGDKAVITDYQDINALCDALSVNVQITHVDSGVKIATSSRNLGVVGYMTAFIRMTQDTSILDPATYRVSSDWVCDGVKLGQDGYSDKDVSPSVSTFKVVKKTSTPPPETCSKQCNVGYKLIKPDSKDCYCEPAYKDGNGVCELGEPIVNEDCKEKDAEEMGESAPPSQTRLYILVGGVVVVLLGLFFIMRN